MSQTIIDGVLPKSTDPLWDRANKASQTWSNNPQKQFAYAMGYYAGVLRDRKNAKRRAKR